MGANMLNPIGILPDDASSITAGHVPYWIDSYHLGNGLNVGTGVYNLVQLDGNGRLPAIDGRNLTNTGIKLLGSGTYRNTGTGSYEDIDYFSTGGALGYKRLVIEITVYQEVAGQTITVGIDPASGNQCSVSQGATPTNINTPFICHFWITQPPETSVGTYLRQKMMWINNVYTETQSINSTDGFDVTADETFYLKVQTNANNCRILWRAYLVG